MAQPTTAQNELPPKATQASEHHAIEALIVTKSEAAVAAEISDEEAAWWREAHRWGC